MCFKDLEQREREIQIAGRAASIIREGARKAGHTRVEFFDAGTMRQFFYPVNGPGVEIGTCIGQIHTLHNIDHDGRTRRKTRPRSGSTLFRSTLIVPQISVQIVVVDVAGYELFVFVVPSDDLARHYFPKNCAATESRIRYYFDDPDGYFPFSKYRDQYGHFGDPMKIAV